MFIKLHLICGEEIYINKNNIEAFGVITKNTYYCENKEYHGYTYVVPNGLTDAGLIYVVKETPEEIYEKIFNLVRSGIDNLF